MARSRRKKQSGKSNGVPIWRSDGAAVIGQVVGDVFHKPARSTAHMLTRPRAWACDVAALDQARAAGAVWVEVHDADTGATYRAALADFYRRGLALDRGHGAQLALPLTCWDVAGGRLSRPGTLQDAAGGPVQLRMF